MPLSNLLRQASINTENQLIVLPDSIRQDFLDNFRSTGAYIVFYQSVPIDHCTHIPGKVSQSCAESELKYNIHCRNGYITLYGAK